MACRLGIRGGAALVLTGLVTAGCGGSAGDGSRGSAAASTPSPSVEARATVNVPPEALPAVAEARADAAKRTGVSEGAWAIDRVEAREWPDGSLGCPQPGMMYAQVVTPGYLIRLRADSRSLEYHSGGRRTVYCGG
jgi:hypothetical protein